MANAYSISPKKPLKKYEYTQIKDLKTGTCINLYAVVKFFKPPSKTRGSDYSMTISLIDSTISEDQKLKCVLFAREEKLLPGIKNVGDIVRLHRLRITTFNGALQGQSGPGFSCLTFAGDKDSDFSCHSTTTHYTITENDQNEVEKLRQWSDMSISFSQDDSVRRTTFSSVRLGQYFDLVCQVLATCELSEDSILLRVWDGSKLYNPVHKEILSSELTRTKLKKNVNLLHQAAGFIYDVKVFDNHVSAAKQIKPGEVIKLYNLHAAKYRGGSTESQSDGNETIEFCLHGGTSYGKRVSVLDRGCEESTQLTRILDEVAAANESIRIDLSSDEENLVQIPSEAIRPSRQNDEECFVPRQNVAQNEIRTPKAPAESKRLHSEEDDILSTPYSSRKRRAVTSINGGPSSSKDIDFDPSFHFDTDVVPPKRKRLEEVKDMSESFDDKLNRSSTDHDDRMCMQMNATVITAHHHIKPCSLAAVNHGHVPNKYRIRARLIEYQPKCTAVNELIRLYCKECHFLASLSWCEDKAKVCRENHVNYYACPNCEATNSNDNVILEHIFMLRFLLRDSTDWAVVQLWRKEAVTFFNDVEPTDVIKDPQKLQHIRAKLNALVNLEELDKDKEEKSVWLECCIKSYSTEVGTCLQMFDTALCDDLLESNDL